MKCLLPLDHPSLELRRPLKASPLPDCLTLLTLISPVHGSILSSERRTGAPASLRALSTGTPLGTGTLTGKPRGGAASPGETPSFGVRSGGGPGDGGGSVFVAEPFPP
ncbi:hypothetical protein OJAV_G00085600 [Oryzias javanicus]|uniref:Uncharacterized protein n=1 Tax=Oryzias javanicus TaxID=123683 RepID=A0A437CYN8_ORYJA|nr:hypothetical protein OJAV_G00085600 [Oryzias javanicus]